MQCGMLMYALLAVSLAFAPSAEGQFQNVLSTLFGGTASPSSTPAGTTAAVTSTPAATTAATTVSTAGATPAARAASPAAEAASPQASPTPTPASTPAATTKATPALAAAPNIAAAAAAPEAKAASPAATPKATPAAKATPKATPAKPSPPPPVPPAPIVIDPSKLVSALPADETSPSPNSAPPSSAPGAASASLTAADLVLRVSGDGVTPFLIPQQTVLLRAFASVMTTVSLADLQIRYVTSSVNMRRRLLSKDTYKSGRVLLQNDTAQATAAANGELYNVAAVTLQANCSSSNAALATISEMQSVVTNNLLSSAFQAYGQPSWGASLLSLTSVDPSVALDTKIKCKKNLGTFCLDNTSLTVAAAEVIMAIGCLFIIVLAAIPCVWLEWHRKSGQMAELDPTPDTPRTPLDKVQQFYNNLVSKAKAASPLHRRVGSNGRNAFKSESPIAARSTVQLTASS